MSAATAESASDDVNIFEEIQNIEWKPSAPDTVVTAAVTGNVLQLAEELQRRRFGCHAESLQRSIDDGVPRMQSVWSLQLAPSARARRLAELLMRIESQLTSGLANGQIRDHDERRNGSQKKKRKHSSDAVLDAQWTADLSMWLCDPPARPQLSAVEFLGVTDLLLHAGSQLPAEIFLSSWHVALLGAQALYSDFSQSENAPVDATDAHCAGLLAETTWRAVSLFGDIKDIAPSQRHVRKAIRNELLERTDTDGTPQAELLPHLPDWLASLVRSHQWAEWFGCDLWNSECRERLSQLLQHASLLLDSHAKLLTTPDGGESALPLFQTAARLCGWNKKVPQSQLLRALERKRLKPHRKLGETKENSKRDSFLANQSDWSQWAVMRSDWSPEADVLAVSHNGSKPELCIAAVGQTVVQGEWDIEVATDGMPLKFADDWSCVCWYSDSDADYIELQQTFDGNLRVERQLLLSRTEHFLILADTVLDPAGTTLEYRSRLPLGHNAVVTCDVPSRECRVEIGDWNARAFPLSLEQDRVLSTPGQLRAVEGWLELEQSGRGGLYVPLVFDWHPAHQAAEADWNVLTVAELLQILPTRVAAAHRLRVGKQQLILYRALVRSDEARTVLGLHTRHETVIGRFTKSGDVEPLVLVES